MLDVTPGDIRREPPQATLERLNREFNALTSCHQALLRSIGEQSLLEENRRLFEAIGRRLEDALTSLVAYLDLSAQESQLRALFQAIPDILWVKDVKGRFLRCNSAFERAVGRSEAEVIGKTDFDFNPIEFAEIFAASDRLTIETGDIVSEEYKQTSREGALVQFEVKKAPLRDQSGAIIGTAGIARDITQRCKHEQDLHIAAAAFDAQEGIVILDADLRVLKVNRAFLEMTQRTEDELIGRTPSEIVDNLTTRATILNIGKTVQREGLWRGEMPLERRRTGGAFPTWTTVAAVRSKGGETTHFVAMTTDITERKEAEQEIVRLAYYDRLTGLANRRLLRDRLHHAVASSGRNDRCGAVLFIDLDDFKLLNETSGHAIGDQVLTEVGKRLVDCLGDAGGVARIGGDEFVALIEDLSEDPGEAATVAKQVGEEIAAALNVPYQLKGGPRQFSASIGVAMFKGDGQDGEEVMKQADIAVNEAKASGRNALRFFDPEMQAALAARANAESALRAAIVDRRFVLYFQPQVNSEGVCIGAEGLARWLDPLRGVIPPGEFIPLAEKTGLILPIGRWALETACERLRLWASEPRMRDLHLSVNVSARQFSQPDFVDQVAQTLIAAGAPADRLVIELTESVVVDDVGGVIDKMKALKALGVRFALDDFGTGYSSLAYLARLPLDQIKIDRSFVTNLPANANDAAVAQTIITLADSLRLGVVAEGVETGAQRAFLEQHGCNLFQGYLFAKPMPIEAFEASLA
jgi:diguanylate cyclase (GGDEF)-like protein/PAS domain S-box-containing protein